MHPPTPLGCTLHPHSHPLANSGMDDAIPPPFPVLPLGAAFGTLGGHLEHNMWGYIDICPYPPKRMGFPGMEYTIPPGTDGNILSPSPLLALGASPGLLREGRLGCHTEG